MRQVKNDIVILGIMLAVSFFTGCSNKTLSFFFDGVPLQSDSLNLVAQNAIKQTDSTNINQVVAQSNSPAYSVHQPYKDKDCKACHDQNSIGKFVEPQPALCYQCHEDFAKTYKTLHAPIEGGECTSCHSPHMALAENNLKRTGQQLCFFCHDQGDILKLESHEGIEDTNCTDCHNPHGSNDEHLLN